VARGPGGGRRGGGGGVRVGGVRVLGGSAALARRTLRGWRGLFTVAPRPELGAGVAAVSAARGRRCRVEHPLGRYYVLARMDAKAAQP